jgi:hypothetical protein
MGAMSITSAMSSSKLRLERRRAADRRRYVRVRSCPECQADLLVDRRGPTVLLRAGMKLLRMFIAASVSADAGPSCPVCGMVLPRQAPRDPSRPGEVPMPAPTFESRPVPPSRRRR